MDTKTFTEFRKWFNKNFALSLDGKYKGLARLLEFMNTRQFDGFISRLACALKKGLQVITLHLCGHTLKLYAK